MLDIRRSMLRVAPGTRFRDSRSTSGDPFAPRDVDASLLRLSRAEARARLRLGRAAVRFVAIRGWDRLGFARLGDYASERLGVSGRELRSLAFVASRLASLPRLAAAFTRGELSWSQVRLLAGAADQASEVAWMDRARGLTVRELADAVRAARRGHPDVAFGEAIDEEANAIEGEPRVHIAIRCPARVTVLWRRAVELARRMLGAQAPAWQAAEAIAAEAISGAPALAAEPPEGASSLLSPAEGKQAERARPFASGVVDGHQEEEEVVDDARFDSLDVFDLDLEMRLFVREVREADARLGRALRRLSDLRVHRALGFDSFDSYVRERLGFSPSKAWSLVALDRRSREATAFGRAYLSGALSWVRAATILPVARGEREAAWVRRALEVTVRELRDEVEWAIDWQDAGGRDLSPPEHGAALERPDLQTCARRGDEPSDRRVTFFGPASVVGVVRVAVAAASGPRDPFWKGLERILLRAVSEWEAQPRHRDPVFARDGWRCAVPACTSRRNLHDHHVEFRSRGGGNERENRVGICAAHHLRGIHRGIVRASGRAPDDLVWELGFRPGRAPLLVLHGSDTRARWIFENCERPAARTRPIANYLTRNAATQNPAAATAAVASTAASTPS
jgi:hypothetical protein